MRERSQNSQLMAESNGSETLLPIKTFDTSEDQDVLAVKICPFAKRKITVDFVAVISMLNLVYQEKRVHYRLKTYSSSRKEKILLILCLPIFVNRSEFQS